MEKKDITLIPQYQKMLEEIMEYRKRNSLTSSNSETAEDFSTIYPDASHVVLIQFMTREISCAKPEDFLWLNDSMLKKAGYRTCKNGNVTKLGGK